ncbi:hypothetical protein FRAHR75_700001 [Frankia sp. Hr75.2]|nr:hypothetical protein FRAHR75_700001 [Frankia sp. Hr75.2]
MEAVRSVLRPARRGDVALSNHNCNQRKAATMQTAAADVATATGIVIVALMSRIRSRARYDT